MEKESDRKEDQTNLKKCLGFREFLLVPRYNSDVRAILNE